MEKGCFRVLGTGVVGNPLTVRLGEDSYRSADRLYLADLGIQLANVRL